MTTKQTAERQMEELEVEEKYARERLALYKAKAYGPRPTSGSRMRELERIHQGAAGRLRRAREKSAD